MKDLLESVVLRCEYFLSYRVNESDLFANMESESIRFLSSVPTGIVQI
jgi:hypothetical protein